MSLMARAYSGARLWISCGPLLPGLSVLLEPHRLSQLEDQVKAVSTVSPRLKRFWTLMSSALKLVMPLLTESVIVLNCEKGRTVWLYAWFAFLHAPKPAYRKGV